jgi:hypothetical protein
LDIQSHSAALTPCSLRILRSTLPLVLTFRRRRKGERKYFPRTAGRPSRWESDWQPSPELLVDPFRVGKKKRRRGGPFGYHGSNDPGKRA